MKKSILFLFVILITLGMSKINAQDEMKIWMDFMTPGEMHKKLQMMEGDWSVSFTSWMSPDGSAQTTNGTCKFEMKFGGRYLFGWHTGSVMGMPMEGLNLIGFDNAKNKFINTWIDNMGTGFAYAEGDLDPNTLIIDCKGKQSDPVTKSDSAFRLVYKIINNNKFIMEMYMVMGDKEIKSLEAVYTR